MMMRQEERERDTQVNKTQEEGAKERLMDEVASED